MMNWDSMRFYASVELWWTVWHQLPFQWNPFSIMMWFCPDESLNVTAVGHLCHPRDQHQTKSPTLSLPMRFSSCLVKKKKKKTATICFFFLFFPIFAPACLSRTSVSSNMLHTTEQMMMHYCQQSQTLWIRPFFPTFVHPCSSFLF